MSKAISDIGFEDDNKQQFSEPDRQLYYLKTLYDVSRDLFSSIDFDEILRNFLLTCMGNFGVMGGAILTSQGKGGGQVRYMSLGLDEEQDRVIRRQATDLISSIGDSRIGTWILGEGSFPKEMSAGVVFEIPEYGLGFLVLGERLTGEKITQLDRELIVTLSNNLVIALKNALSFERISNLNIELVEKNESLERTLNELKAALRKVEILESIKSNLCKFVPATLTRMIEDDSKPLSLDAEKRDVSVMFVDIEGYTKITEMIGDAAVNKLVERYFSVFMDAIYTNNGDVLETSGDGLLVVFLSDDPIGNAREAVNAAITIRRKSLEVAIRATEDSLPLRINIGVASGPAVVGANKFESYTGVRWAYTTHGMTVNMAARICGHARGGAVLLCKETAMRVEGIYQPVCRGCFPLKNISEPVEIFEICC